MCLTFLHVFNCVVSLFGVLYVFDDFHSFQRFSSIAQTRMKLYTVAWSCIACSVNLHMKQIPFTYDEFLNQKLIR